jgi:hypothetical protein
MKEALYEADRSLTFYVAAERERVSTPSTEATLTVWAILALISVLVTLAIGGCA